MKTNFDFKDTEFYKVFERISPMQNKYLYISELSSFNQNEWFTPTNSETNTYDACMYLKSCNLICFKETPIWNNGSFMGYKKEFMYNLDLKY